METVEFKLYEEFEQVLADRFAAFMAGLTTPCTVLIDIESCGGYTEVLTQMEQIISAKKAEGYVFITNVEKYAYSCGMFLFLLGDIKMCAEDAKFMFHSSGFDIEFERLTSTDLTEVLQVLEADDALTNKILAENTDVQPGMLEILKKNDNYLSKTDMIFLGFMQKRVRTNLKLT